jgi:hypothetical protein
MVESTPETTPIVAQPKIDKSLFKKQEPVTLVTCPVRQISDFQKEFRDYIITRSKFPHCKPIPGDTQHKELVMAERLLRNPDFKGYAQEKGIKFTSGSLELSYDNFNLTETLTQLLP